MKSIAAVCRMPAGDPMLFRDDPDRLRRATVDRYADRKNLPDPMGGVRGGKSTEKLKGYAHAFPRALKDGR
jgi:hypothetical protein